MAARNLGRDKLLSGLPKELQSWSNRELGWLWSYMVREGVINWEVLENNLSKQNFELMDNKKLLPRFKDLSIGDSVRIITKFLDNNNLENDLLINAIKTKSEELVNNDVFDWIEIKNHRLLIWIASRVESLVPDRSIPVLSSHPSMLSTERRYEEIISAIDLWRDTCNVKLDLLSNLKNDWVYYKSSDEDTKWIENNDEQLKWAWGYLCKSRRSVNIPEPATTSEYHAAVLASIDEMSYGHSSDKKLFLLKMKKTWSQKKYRDSGKAKKPYNLPLTIKTYAMLEKLAEKSGHNKSKILQELIEKSFKESGLKL